MNVPEKVVTDPAEIFQALKAPFPSKDITWRVSESNIVRGNPWAMVLAYIDARAVQDRLDEVVGPHNWRDRYQFSEHGILCTLEIRIQDEWIAKVDGSPETKVESFKGGISKALVRAASKWGVGRYLYGLGRNFAVPVEKGVPGAQFALVREKIKGDYTGNSIPLYWVPPTLPDWALPEDERKGKK